ncbi:MAG: hypothetical protein LIP04_06885 [Tannerellaceae bacterium]|nr:hypothetical protein [Tannerellaceae bacterium]
MKNNIYAPAAFRKNYVSRIQVYTTVLAVFLFAGFLSAQPQVDNRFRNARLDRNGEQMQMKFDLPVHGKSVGKMESVFFNSSITERGLHSFPALCPPEWKKSLQSAL